MSAFLCPPIHIATLAISMSSKLPLSGTLAVYANWWDMSIDELADDLAIANWQSVNSRYPNKGGWGYDSVEDYIKAVRSELKELFYRPLPPIYRVYGILQCYTYQTCEIAGWHESDVYEKCQRFQMNLCSEMAELLAYEHGGRTGWEYTNEEHEDRSLVA